LEKKLKLEVEVDNQKNKIPKEIKHVEFFFRRMGEWMGECGTIEGGEGVGVKEH
jgi:hypothetical protein